MKRWISRLGLLGSLAVQDLWHDRKVSFCIAASLVAVIAPLLLLFGLKHGVVSQLQNELLSDPRNLEVKMLSSGNYDTAWIERLRLQPEVGFAIGQTRSLNTQADLLVGMQRFVENAEIIPSDAGDPLLNLPQIRLDGQQVILSDRAAQRLQAKVGDNVRLRVSRRLDGINERGELNVQVVAVLDAARFGRAAGFVAPPLLLQLERFRDGYQVPAFGLDTGKPQGELFEGADDLLLQTFDLVLHLLQNRVQIADHLVCDLAEEEAGPARAAPVLERDADIAQGG